MILSPPSADLYKSSIAATSANEEKNISVVPSRQNRKGIVWPLSSAAPPAIIMLAKVIEKHYKPERMNGFQFEPKGLVTFTMIKHDCDICNDVHNNQCYAVADLKTRIFYSKCHADKTKTGVHVPFDQSLDTLSFCNQSEMQEEVDGYFFSSNSSTARMVLGFANAIFASSSRDKIQIPEQAILRYYDGQQYEVALPGDKCAKDQGSLFLQVTLNKVIIRCKGALCSTIGHRKERPSHSSKSAHLWNLSFFFLQPQEQLVLQRRERSLIMISLPLLFLRSSFLQKPIFCEHWDLMRLL
jgi:hypothetical protein